MTVGQLAKRFGCTEEQMRNQFMANAKQLTQMHAKSVSSGKKTNGYTASQLNAHTFNAYAKAVK